MQRLTYTGTNYDEVKRLCGDKVLAPYLCMGYSMLSVDTGEGFVSVNEGDTIVREDDGSLRVEKSVCCNNLPRLFFGKISIFQDCFIYLLRRYLYNLSKRLSLR